MPRRRERRVPGGGKKGWVQRSAHHKARVWDMSTLQLGWVWRRRYETGFFRYTGAPGNCTGRIQPIQVMTRAPWSPPIPQEILHAPVVACPSPGRDRVFALRTTPTGVRKHPGIRGGYEDSFHQERVSTQPRAPFLAKPPASTSLAPVQETAPPILPNNSDCSKGFTTSGRRPMSNQQKG